MPKEPLFPLYTTAVFSAASPKIWANGETDCPIYALPSLVRLVYPALAAPQDQAVSLMHFILTTFQQT